MLERNTTPETPAPSHLESLESYMDLGPRFRYMSRLDVFLFETGVSLGDGRSLTLSRSTSNLWE